MAETKYGLTADGFKRKRLPEIIESLNRRLADKLGVPIETGANSLFGQIIGVFAYEISDLWEVGESSYYAMYPHTAEGVQLSNSAALAGIAQIVAERTTINATCYGVDGAVVPYGAQISSSDNTDIIFTCTDVLQTISSSRACTADIMIPAAATSGTAYTLTIDGEAQSYTAGSTDTAASVLAGLAALFSFGDRTLSVNNGVLSITMSDQAETFSVAMSSNLALSSLGSPFSFICETYGAVEPRIGAVNNIVTPYSGWTGVSNNVAANVGREAETDIALRQRWSASVYGRAMAMTDAIAAAVYQECSGVKSLPRVYENTGDIGDAEGRPPHSVEAVVDGGDPQEICNVIFRKKAAGIDTYGSISRTVTDSAGMPHEIHYNAPQEVPVWLRIKITKDESDEAFGGLRNVKKAVLKAAESYAVGQDVILQKFIGAIYGMLTGIGYVAITAATGTVPGTYGADNIGIDSRHVAVFDESRIEVSAT